MESLRENRTRSYQVLLIALVLLTSLCGWAAPSPWGARFIFGSYGRVGIASNLRGGQGRPAHVVSHGPRLAEVPYLELELSYLQHLNSETRGIRTTITLAFDENLFHYNGKFDANVAIRNLYAESFGLLSDKLKIWVGSRMYRGDDVYLFDYWPLDNLNTVGAGVSYTIKNWLLAFHVGTNRLDDDFQVQKVDVAKEPFGSESIVFMERQRVLGSAKITGHWKPTKKLGIKASLYGEFHFLPSGTLKLENDLTEKLPQDLGYVVGAQIGIWGYGGKGSFTNLFVRFAGGLAAYGELAIPFGLDSEKKALKAKELVLALSTNWESKWVGLMGGFYARYFVDADPNKSDLDDGWEGSLSIRPHIYLTKHFHLLFEVNYQFRYPFGLDPKTGGRLFPQVVQVGIMPTLSWDRGSYSRPQLRLVYALSYLNGSARSLYNDADVRRHKPLQHYLGVVAEWWFNSSSYR